MTASAEPSSPPTLRLQVSGLSKSFGAIRALDNVDFEVRRGETMALLGENGAGKSTLVKVLSGLVIPDAGEIRVDGKLCSLRSSRQSQAAGIAVVQQEYSSVPSLTIAENVFLGQASGAFIWRRRVLAKKAIPLLEMVGLEYLDPFAPVSELGVAERQLLEIARVLARNAQVLLFDEPTAALSDSEIERVLAVVRRLAAEGRSVIYVTHRLREIYEIADRVTVLRDGSNLPPRDVRDATVDDVVSMMLGRRLSQLFPERPPLRGDPILSVQNLTAPGLDGPVSLVARAGEIVGLTGQMGSGAGLVVEMLAAQTTPTGGEVTLNGVDVDIRSRAAGIKRGIAYCSPDRQHDGLFGQLTVLRNLTSGSLASVSTRGFISARRERAAADLAARNMALDTKRLPSHADTLSGGNQQKIALGRWVGGNAKVLLIEEPTRGVDVGARAEIYRQLRELCAQGLAVVVASSDTSEIAGLCDTIGTFYRGRLTALRPHESWTDEELLAHVMHGGGLYDPNLHVKEETIV